MRWIPVTALLLLLCSCQTAPESDAPKDYAARADADIAKYTITNNDVYGFEPEGKFDPSTVSILESHKENGWTIYKVNDKKGEFDSVELTVDGSGAIIRLRFFKLAHSAVGRRDAIETAYSDLVSKYKVVQRTGDLDTANLTVYVAESAAAWKERYVAYLQLMDEPNKRTPGARDDFHLGAQICWILQPHLSEIRAIVRQEGQGSSLVLDFHTKIYAAVIKSQTPPPSPVPDSSEPES
jgi:hypothetical protein